MTAFRDGVVTKRSNRRTEGFTESDLEIGYQVVHPGDLVVHSMDGFAGAIGVSDSQGKMSPVVHIYQARGDARFFAYALRSLAGNGYIASLAKGVRERTSTFDRAALADVLLPVPPVHEQRRIADFLDERAARIDRLVAGRRIQAERLDALRDSSAHSVFAALPESPGVPLRWLLRYFEDGDWIESPYIVDDGVRLIQTGNIGVGNYKEQGHRFISEQTFESLRCKEVLEGDVLISRLSQPVARACRAPRLAPKMVTAVDVVIARPEPALLDAQFLVEYLSTPRHLSDMNELARGATMQRLSRSQVGQIRVPTPHLSLQQSVAAHLEDLRARTSDQARDLARSVTALREYKQSLITAAVTGRLDVTTASGRSIPA